MPSVGRKRKLIEENNDFSKFTPRAAMGLSSGLLGSILGAWGRARGRFGEWRGTFVERQCRAPNSGNCAPEDVRAQVQMRRGLSLLVLGVVGVIFRDFIIVIDWQQNETKEGE